MVAMSSAIIDPSADLGRALHRRGDPISPREFLDVLQEITGGTSEQLTLGERDFLLEHTELTEVDLGEEARAATRIELTRNRLVLDRQLVDDALTTSEVAELLGRAEANVRRSRISGDLHALNPGDARGLRFPRWQFSQDGAVVPGLRRIVPAFPPSTHPVSIERAMTEPDEDLEGMSAVEWLFSGGSVDAVVTMVDAQGYV